MALIAMRFSSVELFLQPGLQHEPGRFRFRDQLLAHERLQLAYGAWLRRQRRVVESRAPLRAARDAFDALGVIPWGERARQELRASGETSRRRTPAAWDQLSPQDLQIAQLAASGLSNREIGQRLTAAFRQSQVGTTHRALTLEDGRLAVTGNYLKVRIPPGRRRNEWIRVAVTSAGDPMSGEVQSIR